MKQKAQFDYSLAELFGLSVSRILDSGNKFPAIYEVYPHLFENDQEMQEAVQEDLATTNSINNFMAFAMAHNAKMNREVE